MWQWSSTARRLAEAHIKSGLLQQSIRKPGHLIHTQQIHENLQRLAESDTTSQLQSNNFFLN